MYLFDYYLSSNMLYIVLVVPALILSLIAQAKVKSTYARMSKVTNTSGYTGAQAAMAVLRYYGITDVYIEETSGKLSDHFDPRKKVIRLSKEVYYGNSVASVGIACHEAGHAAQHAQGYAPIKVRNAIIPVCNIGSYLGIPLAFAGYFLGFEPLILIGLGLYSLIAIFQLITLPVEFNASSRAVKVIDETGLLRGEEEIRGTKKVLSAAAMTYVAALAVSLANLLRFAVLFLGRGKRRN
ncbi:MAG: zinc metallopeptidase [Clostridia bacterium]|nr:zinc metallopeptidase [Clostridia bacterium]